jgi:hypothetical protein
LETQPANSHWFVRIVAYIGYGFAGLVFIYMFGTGPAGYMYHRSPEMRPALETLYRPLGALVDGTPLARPIFKYSGWWEDLARDKESHHR